MRISMPRVCLALALAWLCARVIRATRPAEDCDPRPLPPHRAPTSPPEACSSRDSSWLHRLLVSLAVGALLAGAVVLMARSEGWVTTVVVVGIPPAAQIALWLLRRQPWAGAGEHVFPQARG